MKVSYKEAIRKLLIDHQDGLTVNEIAKHLGAPDRSIRKCISLSMPDVYIDRWTPSQRGQYWAVYCRARIPPNCPHPRDRYNVVFETQWRSRSIAAMERIAA